MCEQNLKRKAAVILSLCMAVSGVSLVLGGCTRREQLVLETADMADESGLLMEKQPERIRAGDRSSRRADSRQVRDRRRQESGSSRARASPARLVTRRQRPDSTEPMRTDPHRLSAENSRQTAQ